MTNANTTPAPTSIKLAKRIASAGLCSRREAEKWIVAGRVTVNGKPCNTPATRVTKADKIAIDNTLLSARTAKARLFAFYKPTGVLVTEHDPKNRKTIYDLLPDVGARLIPVGRLDMNSEGLLLLSTCPTLASELMHSTMPRVYRVRVLGQLSSAQETEIQNGITTEDGMHYAPCSLEFEKGTGRNVWYQIILSEGKNREIRNIFRHFGVSVNRLIRIQYGKFPLSPLKVGDFQEISL